MAPRAVAAAGLACATLAALCFVVDHPGLAGVLGLVGLLLGEIARASAGTDEPLVDALNVLSDTAIAAGYVGAAVVAESGICVLLGLLALILLAWLPNLVGAGTADAWLAIDRLARIGLPPRTRPAFLDALLGADGSIQPLLRWGSLLIALLLLVVLPQGDGWRF